LKNKYSGSSGKTPRRRQGHHWIKKLKNCFVTLKGPTKMSDVWVGIIIFMLLYIISSMTSIILTDLSLNGNKCFYLIIHNLYKSKSVKSIAVCILYKSLIKYFSIFYYTPFGSVWSKNTITAIQCTAIKRPMVLPSTMPAVCSWLW
jgi:hypothetical protein